MNRLPFLPAVVLLFAAAGSASAQQFGRPGYYNPYLNQPRISPYLDIARGGTNPALNYYLGTLPEVERRTAQAVYGNAILRLDRVVAGEEQLDEGAIQSGSAHRSFFGNTFGYFPAGNSTRPAAGPARPPARKGTKGTN